MLNPCGAARQLILTSEDLPTSCRDRPHSGAREIGVYPDARRRATRLRCSTLTQRVRLDDARDRTRLHWLDR
eukprot:1816061-Rhodomonas_salina.2